MKNNNRIDRALELRLKELFVISICLGSEIRVGSGSELLSASCQRPLFEKVGEVGCGQPEPEADLGGPGNGGVLLATTWSWVFWMERGPLVPENVDDCCC